MLIPFLVFKRSVHAPVWSNEAAGKSFAVQPLVMPRDHSLAPEPNLSVKIVISLMRLKKNIGAEGNRFGRIWIIRDTKLDHF
jgi:hypothetical protein